VSQVNDYTAENAAGNVVRADINNIFDAIKSNNSGGSEPSNPGKFFPWGRTSDGTLLMHDGLIFRPIGKVGEDNLGLLLRSGGTMTGPVLGDDASGASTPAYAFDGDPDTGLFRKSANTIGLSTAGTERAIIDSNGVTIQAQGDIRLADSDSSHYVALQAASTVSSNLIFTLPSAYGSNGQLLQTNGSGVLSFSTVQGVPSGAVFCIAVATTPSDYLECNGASVSRSTYAALFAVIGTAYGSASGTTFNLPDLRGEFIRGFDNGRGVDSGRSVASSQSGQNESHTHAATVTDPGHDHYMYAAKAIGGHTGNGSGPDERSTSQDLVTGDKVTGVTVSNAATGGNETRPRNIAMVYVIKT